MCNKVWQIPKSFINCKVLTRFARVFKNNKITIDSIAQEVEDQINSTEARLLHTELSDHEIIKFKFTKGTDHRANYLVLPKTEE